MSTRARSPALRTITVAIAAIAPALLVALMALAPAQAQEAQTTIQGAVANGTPGAAPPEGVPVALHVARQGDLLDVRATTTSAQGNFTFDNVTAGEGVVYRVVVVYLNAIYSAILDQSDLSQPVQLTVYEAGGDPGLVRVPTNTVLVQSADRDLQLLTVLELVALDNSDLRAVAADKTPLLLPLPRGATDLRASLDQFDAQVVQVQEGLALTSVLAPGTHELLLSYKVAYGGSEADLARSFFLPTDSVRLLVPAMLARVRTSGLAQEPTVSMGATDYLSFRATGLRQGDRVEIRLERLPASSPLLRLWRALERTTGRILLPVALGLGLAALAVYGLVSRRPAEGSLPQAAAPTDRASLVAALADLDDRFSTHSIGQQEYRAQRETLKDRLLRLELGQRASQAQPAGQEPAQNP
ncbi:MAG: hypothetical protein HYY00_08855 [Chloroflexi bacterium]|nr:hypothetical protein [Chloroflexota bacterium]